MDRAKQWDYEHFLKLFTFQDKLRAPVTWLARGLRPDLGPNINKRTYFVYFIPCFTSLGGLSLL